MSHPSSSAMFGNLSKLILFKNDKHCVPQLIAEWSKALHLSGKINENRKDPTFATWQGQSLKNTVHFKVT